jgi:hypothetical protein
MHAYGHTGLHHVERAHVLLPSRPMCPGSPHAHLVIWLTDPADVERVNASITCTMPDARRFPELAGQPWARDLARLVKRCMAHVCNGECRPPHKHDAPRCKNHFPMEVCSEAYLDADTDRWFYPVLHNSDAMTAPYLPELLLVWRAHCYIVRMTSTAFLQYLLKYVFKTETSSTAAMIAGVPEAFGLPAQLSVGTLHGIASYLQARVVSVNEAHYLLAHMPLVLRPWRVSFELITLDAGPSSDAGMYYGRAKHGRTMSDKYFDRGNVGKDLTITAFFARYKVHNSASPASAVGHDTTHHAITMREHPVIAFMRSYMPTHGELFFMASLLQRKPIPDRRACFSSDNHTRTFAEECVLQGIYPDDDALRQYIDDLPDCMFEYKRQRLREQDHIDTVCPITAVCAAAQAAAADAALQQQPGLPAAPAGQPGAAVPTEAAAMHELCKRKMAQAPFDAAGLAARLAALAADPRFADQQRAFTAITSTADQTLWFLTGSAGVGKSHLITLLVAHYCLQSKRVLVVASTGKAQHNLRHLGALTLHHGLGLPTSERYVPLRGRGHNIFIQLIDVLIIEEVSLVSSITLEHAHRRCMEADTAVNVLKIMTADQALELDHDEMSKKIGEAKKQRRN